jgi:transcription antitermination factor NusG
MSEHHTEIKVGDSVRARAGAFKGRVGTAMRVVTTHDEELISESVLVSFPAEGADYLNVSELEKLEAESG